MDVIAMAIPGIAVDRHCTDDSPCGPDVLNKDPSRFLAVNLTSAQSLPVGWMLPAPMRTICIATPEAVFSAPGGGPATSGGATKSARLGKACAGTLGWAGRYAGDPSTTCPSIQTQLHDMAPAAIRKRRQFDWLKRIMPDSPSSRSGLLRTNRQERGRRTLVVVFGLDPARRPRRVRHPHFVQCPVPI